MYDKYDSPHGEEEYEEESSGIEIPGIEIIQENWKKIAAAFVILIVAFVAYDFFIGSYKEVTFEAKDTEGNTINATIKVMQGEAELGTVKSGGTMNLKPGQYTATIIAEGYKGTTDSFSVSDSATITEKLEIDKKLELKGNFPETFATGESKEITVTIANNDTSSTEVTLILEEDAKDALELEYSPINARQGENIIIVVLKAKENLSSKEIGEDKKGTIRIEGLDNKNAKISGTYTLIEFNPSKAKVTFGSSQTKADFGRADAGETVSKIIKIANNNEIELKDVKISVEITATEFSDPSEVESWFKFSPENTVSVSADGEEQITVIMSVPATVKFPSGKESESIIGALYATNTLLNRKFDLTAKIEKVDTGISIGGIPETKTISKGENGYSPQIGFIDVKNTGDADLTNVDIRVSCSGDNITNWLSVENAQEYSIDTLAKDSTQQVAYSIEIPSSALPEESSVCRIGVFYNDPAGTRQSEEKAIIIKAA